MDKIVAKAVSEWHVAMLFITDVYPSGNFTTDDSLNVCHVPVMWFNVFDIALIASNIDFSITNN